MERSELKKLLKDMGVHEKLAEMPAIVEPIYEEFMEDTVAECKKSKRIQVSKDGKFLFDGKNFYLDDEDKAVVEFDNTKIFIDEYGIEVSYLQEKNEQSLSITREDGKIRTVTTDNGGASWKESISLDNGSWSITNADGELISTASSHRRNRKEILKLREEEILSKFNVISSSIIANYPHTAQWYVSTKAAIKAYIDGEKIKSLEKDVKKLTAQNKELTGQNERLSGVLGISLELIKEVKKSPFGKLFFHKGLKRYEQNTEGLPEGTKNDK